MFQNWYNVHPRPKDMYKGAIVTAQVAWELDELIKIYDGLAPMHVMEIGSQLGGTLWHWLDGAPQGATVINIDILQNQDEETAAALPARWQSWTPEGVTLHTLIGRSDDKKIIKQSAKLMPEVDFLFIDACHTYEGVKYDFETYGPRVRKGGVIALHDLITPDSSPWIQVWQFWREIQAAGYVTQELRANSFFGGIGVVYV